MDRFMMQLGMGFPTFEEEISILNRFIQDSPLNDLKPVCTIEEIVQMQDSISQVFVHNIVMGYLVHIIEATRKHPDVSLGVSPRGSLALLRASQSYAAIKGLTYVTPDMIKYLAPYVLSHRLILRTSYNKTNSREEIIRDILDQVTVPTEDFSH